MQNPGRSNNTGGNWQTSYSTASPGYSCSVPRPYAAVPGGTYQAADGTGVIRGYCSPLVASQPPKPSGLESSVTKTNIATYVVTSRPNSAVRGLCVPAGERSNGQHFSVAQQALAHPNFQANYSSRDSPYVNETVRDNVSSRVSGGQFPSNFMRLPTEATPQQQSDVQSLIERFEKLQSEFGPQSPTASPAAVNFPAQTERSSATPVNQPVNANGMRTNLNISPTVTGVGLAQPEADAKSWSAKHQAVPTFSVRSCEVSKPQPQTALPLQQPTTQNHVTFASANVSRTAAPLPSRTNAHWNAQKGATERSSEFEYEYELRRIDCDTVTKRVAAPSLGAAKPSTEANVVVNVQTVRSAGSTAASTSRVQNPVAVGNEPSQTPTKVDEPAKAETVGGAQAGAKVVRGRSATKRPYASALRTHYPPALYRLFMEQHIEHLFRLRQERLERRAQLEREMTQMGVDESKKTVFRRMLINRESRYTRLRRIKLSARDFETIKLIGVGAFGKVYLVRKCASQQSDVAFDDRGESQVQLFAMKKLNKADLTRKNQLGHVKAERDILAESDNEWVVKLYYSFQDARYLYFILEYVPGGDLMSLLIRMGIFPEELARFYVAELILAVESVHAMRFIHRDIKPDNILICADGHLKLTDFGLCTGFRWTHSSKFYQAHIAGPGRPERDFQPEPVLIDKPKLLEERARANERARELRVAYSLVGTPNYIAPEVLLRCGYTETVDWWSIGVILYEMLVGQPPFWATTPAATQYKVINHKTYLHFPTDGRLSVDALSLIRALIRDPPERLGRNGAAEIKAHRFFQPLTSVSPFEQLRHLRAPWHPVIAHPTDTSNFDPIDEETLRMLSDNEADAEPDSESPDGVESESQSPRDGSSNDLLPNNGDALATQRSASCETLNVIESDETANVTLTSVLHLAYLNFEEESESSDGELSAMPSVQNRSRTDATRRTEDVEREKADSHKRKNGRRAKSKSKSKQIADESSVIPPAPYLDFTFRRFFDEPDTQRRAAAAQHVDNAEYFENFV